MRGILEFISVIVWGLVLLLGVLLMRDVASRGLIGYPSRGQFLYYVAVPGLSFAASLIIFVLSRKVATIRHFRLISISLSVFALVYLPLLFGGI